jgi:hypothetical protein
MDDIREDVRFLKEELANLHKTFNLLLSAYVEDKKCKKTSSDRDDAESVQEDVPEAESIKPFEPQLNEDADNELALAPALVPEAKDASSAQLAAPAAQAQGGASNKKRVQKPNPNLAMYRRAAI